jgi:orotate phosphoribosyltransferase
MPIRTEKYWSSEYDAKGAFWGPHDRNPQRPHPLITSGCHSDRYTNSGLVLDDPVFTDVMAQVLVNLLHSNLIDVYSINWVIGPAKGAIPIAFEMALLMSRGRDGSCLWTYVEKEGEGSQKTIALNMSKIRAKERVLLCDDVLVTGGTLRLTARALEEAGAFVLPYIATPVNQSGREEIDGRKIIALIQRPIPIWTPAQCPLCAIGSRPVRPKTGKNWELLNAAYPV